ncbi:MAG: hypothetical protein EOP09_06995 [Proteobacteria bacterium]|nr:MAG: hypothetical protein EOP09_06995 [Pseudomonadota bacterium]
MTLSHRLFYFPSENDTDKSSGYSINLWEPGDMNRKIGTLLILAGTLLITAAQASSLEYRGVPNPVRVKLEDTLTFLKSMKAEQALPKNPASPLHREVFGEFDGENYLRWFETRIKRIGIDSCGGGSATACAIYFMPTWMYLTPYFVRSPLSRVAQLAVLLHEARHSEHDHNGWVHVECPIPFLDDQGQEIKSYFSGDKLAGLKACDDSEYGSYAAEYLFMSHVADYCSNCTATERNEARTIADQGIYRITDLRAREALRRDRADH